MIAGEGLSAWLADGQERMRSAAAVERFGKSFPARPEFANLAAELASPLRQSAEGVLDAARGFFEDTEAVEAAVSAMIDAAREDCFFRPAFRTPLSAIHTGLILFEHPSLTLLLAIMSPDALATKRMFAEGPTAISFSGQHTCYHFVRSGGATLSFWEAPDSGAQFVGDPGLRCRLVTRRRIADGETVKLDAGRQGFVIEHASSDLVYFQALTPLEAAPVITEYDSRTLTFASASSADDVGSRVGMMLSLLRLMDRSDAAPLFVNLLPSLTFHDRWHAMREFVALDAELALPHLREMAASDPHPEVRAAARQTLDLFFLQTTVKEEVPCLA